MIGVTIGVGPWWESIARRNCLRAQHYLGIETIVLTEQHMRRYGVSNPQWLKSVILDLFPSDTVLYFDADLVWTDYWDVSELVNRPELICVRELVNGPTIVGEAVKLEFEPREYFNSGLMIVNTAHHREWMQLTMRLSIHPRALSMVWHEQTCLNWARAKLQVPTHFLPARYNFICQPPLTSIVDEVRFVGVHFAGGDKKRVSQQSALGFDEDERRPFRAGELDQIFLERPIIYRRVGYDERPMQLEADGTIGLGAARCETRWIAFGDGNQQYLSLCGDNYETCRLKRVNAARFEGQWIAFEQMPAQVSLG